MRVTHTGTSWCVWRYRRTIFYSLVLILVKCELSATTLSDGCYAYMFQGCTSLESVIVHVTGEWDTVSTEAWLSDVAPDGTLYNLGGANGIPEDDPPGCPSGWTIEGPEPPHPETLDYFWITPEEDAKIVVKFGSFS